MVMVIANYYRYQFRLCLRLCLCLCLCHPHFHLHRHCYCIVTVIHCNLISMRPLIVKERATLSKITYPLRGGNIPSKVKLISRESEVGSIWFLEDIEGERIVVLSSNVDKSNLSKCYLNTTRNICKLWREITCNKVNICCYQVAPLVQDNVSSTKSMHKQR